MRRLKEIGKIKTYNSKELKTTKFGIGLEKLDRNLFNPAKTYDYIEALGVKYVRLQSGWARTEKKEGVYDFTWLDEVIDNLIKRGLKPWLCMCYGNGIYSPKANEYFGGVGVPPIFTQRERDAWCNYCKKTAEHFKNRVEMYEVWNEPDGIWCWKHGVNGTEYGNFVIETSKAIKSVDENAKILAGSMAQRFNLSWMKDAFNTGMADFIDMYTYHNYSADCKHIEATVRMLRSIINEYGSHIKLVQGEAGAPSEINGAGAMSAGLWTEDKQAKLMLRRHICDLQSEVEFFSHFTTVDMVEALNGLSADKASYLDYGYFGVLSAEFDENGYSIGEYTPKKSYYALQTLSAVFHDAKISEMPIMGYYSEYTQKIFGVSESYANLEKCAFCKDNGSLAFCYYKHTDVMTESFEGLVSFVVNLPREKMHLVDLMNGKVYQIPEDMIADEGNGVFRLMFLPVRDYPLLLTFGDFFEFA